MTSLTSTGIAALELRSQAPTSADHGKLIGLVAACQRGDRSRGALAHV